MGNCVSSDGLSLSSAQASADVSYPRRSHSLIVEGVAFRFRQHVSRVPVARAQQPTHAGKKLAGTQGDGNRTVESNPTVSDAVAVASQYYGHLRTGWQVLAKMGVGLLQ